jgi:hypothetical protein
MKAFGQFNFPVFCIPIKHKNKAFGVLVLDTFDMVQKAPYDPMPEPGLRVFLEHLVSNSSVIIPLINMMYMIYIG